MRKLVRSTQWVYFTAADRTAPSPSCVPTSNMSNRKKSRTLPPCVYQKHGAFWLVKRNKWTRLGGDLRTALAEYARIVEQRPGGMPALIDDAMKLVKPQVSASTWGNYETAARHLKYAFRDFDPPDVTAPVVWQLRDGMASTPNMANRCLSLLRQVLDYACRRSLVERNAAREVKMLPERERDRLLTAEEYEAIYAKAGPRLQIIMDLLYLTGQRVNDVLRLKRSDVSDDGIYFQQQKTKKKLLVALGAELRVVVDRAKALHGDIPAVTLLVGRRRGPPDYRSVNLQWQVARKAAAVSNAQLRDLRAMSLTEAEEEGKDPTALAGHSSPAMTRRYLRRKRIARVTGPSLRQSLDN